MKRYIIEGSNAAIKAIESATNDAKTIARAYRLHNYAVDDLITEIDALREMLSLLELAKDLESEKENTWRETL